MSRMLSDTLDSEWNSKGSTKKTESVKFHGKIVRETDRAILFALQTDAGLQSEGEWFPLSQVVSIHRTWSIVTDTLDSIVVKLWIAQQKGLA